MKKETLKTIGAAITFVILVIGLICLCFWVDGDFYPKTSIDLKNGQSYYRHIKYYKFQDSLVTFVSRSGDTIKIFNPINITLIDKR